MLNYFNFKKFNGEFLLTNDLGRYIFLKPEEFRDFLADQPVQDPAQEKRLIKNAFRYETSTEAFTADHRFFLRHAKRYVFSGTQLHIFVVTTACNGHCVYCQAQNGVQEPHAMMSRETARKAVDLALQSPAESLTFEFQGGEPTLNFDVIRYIVKYSRANSRGKDIRYSLVTNFTTLSDEMLDFIKANHIGLSTSLDGCAAVHNHNRPLKNGDATYDKVVETLKKVRDNGLDTGAIETTTRYSLSHAREIVDTYVDLGFHNIFLRPLTPLGSANHNWKQIGYEPEEFLEFYTEAFNYILEKNLSGYQLSENYAAIMLQKIITGEAQNYMELRSPCGAALGQVAYYCDGNVYTCDEGRMIAEMGNDIFRLGTVDNTYDELMNSKVCRAVCSKSITESLPSCSDCVYQPYCGVCPAVNYMLYQDLEEKTPNNYHCRINKGILDLIFTKLQEDDYAIRQILRSWFE